MEIEIRVENTGQKIFMPQGCSLDDLRKVTYPEGESVTTPRIVAAYVNNKIKELNYTLFSNKSVRFVEITSTEGRRVYARSLFFVLQKAVLDVIGSDVTLRIMHPIGKNYYAQIKGLQSLSDSTIDKIKARMRTLIDAGLPIVRQKMELEHVRAIFMAEGYTDKIDLIDTRPQYYISVFSLAGLHGYFYGAMVPSTNYLKLFDIAPYAQGLAVLMPSRDNVDVIEPLSPSDKLSDVFRLNQKWIDILNIENIGVLNKKIIAGGASEMIKIGEALQEKNISDIADTIAERHYNGGMKIILISGPSSSGKTSFAKRLSIQLKVLGIVPEQISLDNYFVERSATPRDENGEYDFESLQAVDIDSFDKDLNSLLSGKTIELPSFDFLTGSRRYNGRQMTLGPRSVVIVEGIHALTPALTSTIDQSITFKIYASALTALSMDNMSAIHTTDNRLLRRVVRDHNYRGRSTWETLKGWQSVRRGEDRHIFPFQEQADVMFNTALFFEFSVLKPFAIPLLLSVPANEPEFAEALRLLKFLNCFTSISEKELPPTSILREFVGGSSFEY